MIFEVGKTYRHNSGKIMTIIGRLKTHIWGECLIGECDTGELIPVGEQEDNAVNWHEIGHWIKEESIYGWDGKSYQCSACGRSIHLDTKMEDLSDYPYCHCGCRMIEPQETEEDCRDCNNWKTCECGEKGHKADTSMGFSTGECKDYIPIKEEKSCDTCGQPRNIMGQCIPFREGRCVERYEKWIPATEKGGVR